MTRKQIQALLDEVNEMDNQLSKLKKEMNDIINFLIKADMEAFNEENK